MPAPPTWAAWITERHDERRRHAIARAGHRDRRRRLFLQQMIEHHRGAIDMAQEEATNGQNSDAVALANTIIEAQTSEISTMEELLATL